jgi:hypothetical protein
VQNSVQRDGRQQPVPGRHDFIERRSDFQRFDIPLEEIEDLHVHHIAIHQRVLSERRPHGRVRGAQEIMPLDRIEDLPD